MKIVHLSTYDAFGGAARACLRLHQALRRHGVDSHVLVQQQDAPTLEAVERVGSARWGSRTALARYATERLYFATREASKQVRFAFSPAMTGVDLSKHPRVREADVLHLHWVQFGFLSLNGLRKLLTLGKPVVWTLHDMWAFTGGCHYSGDCRRFETHCGHCPFLKRPGRTDLSYRVFRRKLRLLEGARVHVVASSNWLREEAEKSTLLRNQPTRTIATPVDTQQFNTVGKAGLYERIKLPVDRKLILFGAVNTQDPRKGFDLLAQALGKLRESFSEDELEVMTFGKIDEAAADLPFPTRHFGTIDQPGRLVDLYNAADAFVLPSREDNLPNTVLESLACGTPVAAFRAGGLPDMVAHRGNGYLAEPFSTDDLAEGLRWVLQEGDVAALREAARTHAEATYAEPVVAQQHAELYEQMLRG